MSKVLLLNASFEPLTSLTLRAAFELLFDEKAYIVEGEAGVLRSPSTHFEIPSVIRLAVYKNVPRRKVRWTKENVLRRDEYTCVYCLAKPGGLKKGGKIHYNRGDFSVEHIQPQSRGGRDTWVNTACACLECNSRKGSKTPSEAGLKLQYEPRTPRTNVLVFGGSVPKEWKKYIEF
jgi:5-methylcytosine-specific restriction endonuclease McrA